MAGTDKAHLHHLPAYENIQHSPGLTHRPRRKRTNAFEVNDLETIWLSKAFPHTSKYPLWPSRRYFWSLEYEDNAQNFAPTALRPSYTQHSLLEPRLRRSEPRLRRSDPEVEECMQSACPTSGLDLLCKMQKKNESSAETCRLCWPDPEDASKLEERRKFCEAVDNLAQRSVWAIGGVGLGLLLISIAALLVSKKRRNGDGSNSEDPRLLRPGRRPPLGRSANRTIPEESENDLAGEAKTKPWYSRLWSWPGNTKVDARHPEEIHLGGVGGVGGLADPERGDRERSGRTLVTPPATGKRKRPFVDGAHNSTSTLDSKKHAKWEKVQSAERSADATGHEARGRTTRRSGRSSTTLEQEIDPKDGTNPMTYHGATGLSLHPVAHIVAWWERQGE
ncbi:MAG: hypothetical protein LQ342_001607 [Letrouitia transgressa]|nr:MAG: hypothetical protein LQ342_001607 [Letrouitia transgressa]